MACKGTSHFSVKVHLGEYTSSILKRSKMASTFLLLQCANTVWIIRTSLFGLRCIKRRGAYACSFFPGFRKRVRWGWSVSALCLQPFLPLSFENSIGFGPNNLLCIFTKVLSRRTKRTVHVVERISWSCGQV